MQATRLPARAARGQVLIIAGGIMVVLIALVGLVVDLGWYQDNVLRVQRAADAAALAGVVDLPAKVPTAYGLAIDEATKNGYVDGTGPTVVTPTQDSGNPRRLNVTISTTIDTFFLRVIGLSTLPITRSSSAEFILPIPMGSPLNYYGVGCLDTNGSEPDCTIAGNPTDDSGVSTAPADIGVTGAGAPSPLTSQGFWGAIFTKGGDSRNGDSYSPTDFSGGLGGGPGANPDYDPSGYGYSVEIPAGGGGQSSRSPCHGGRYPGRGSRRPPRTRDDTPRRRAGRALQARGGPSSHPRRVDLDASPVQSGPGTARHRHRASVSCASRAGNNPRVDRVRGAIAVRGLRGSRSRTPCV